MSVIDTLREYEGTLVQDDERVVAAVILCNVPDEGVGFKMRFDLGLIEILSRLDSDDRLHVAECFDHLARLFSEKAEKIRRGDG